MRKKNIVLFGIIVIIVLMVILLENYKNQL